MFNSILEKSLNREDYDVICGWPLTLINEPEASQRGVEDKVKRNTALGNLKRSCLVQINPLKFHKSLIKE